MPPVASNNGDAEPALREGQIFAKLYRIGEQLGYGGFGAVFSAEEIRLKRRVAIKVLHPKYANDKKTLRRFHIEAIASSRLNHPCIVKVYASGVAEDGTPFIAMEYVEGETLQARLKALHLNNQRMSSTKALQLMLQAARVIAIAHDLGIYHRDLKPHNFMLTSDPDVAGSERIKLLDFGIAKLIAEGGKEEEHEGATSTGDLLPGSTSYMPPEQYMLYKGVTGQEGKMDVYALGVITYLVHAGRLPLYHEDPAVMMGLTLGQEPDPLIKIDPKISPGVSELVQQMLAKDAPVRPTMAQVRDRITHLLGQPVSGPEIISVRATAEHKAMLAKFSTAEQEAELANTYDAKAAVAPEILFMEAEADVPPTAGKAEKSLGSRSTNLQALGDLHMSTGRSAGQQITSPGTRDRRRRTSLVGVALLGGVLVTGGSVAIWRLQTAPHLTATQPSSGAAGRSTISPIASSAPEKTVAIPPTLALPTPTLPPAAITATTASKGEPSHKSRDCTPAKITEHCISGAPLTRIQQRDLIAAAEQAEIALCPKDRILVTTNPRLEIRRIAGIIKRAPLEDLSLALRGSGLSFVGEVVLQCKNH